MMCRRKGFLLLEALLAILVLAIAFTASLNVMSQVMTAAKRSEDTTRAILVANQLMFDLESGERLDLVRYGGRYAGSGDFKAKVRIEDNASSLNLLKSEIMGPGDRPLLSFDLWLPERLNE